MSKVTIYFGQNMQVSHINKETIINRIFNFIFTKANAKPTWTEVYTSINLTISSSDMDTLTVAIPPSSVSYTVEVPMGDSRLFTMFAYEGTVKKWGGHILADLYESEQSISLSVYPVVTNFNASSGSTEVDLSWWEVTGVSGYRVYRADNEYGPYQLIGTATPSTTVWYYDFSGAAGVYYYYSVSAFTSSWEGERCDPKRQRRM